MLSAFWPIVSAPESKRHSTRAGEAVSSLKSQGAEGPIAFEVYYEEEGNARPITYELAIDLDSSGRPYVLRERLRQRRKGQRHGWPFLFLILNEGKGVAWRGDTKGRQIDENAGQLKFLQFLATCGTWEKLADALYPGGAKAPSRKGWQSIGAEKTRWAESIAPRMNPAENRSPSFCFFRDNLRRLTGADDKLPANVL